jgi:hypothetical protein
MASTLTTRPPRATTLPCSFHNLVYAPFAYRFCKLICNVWYLFAYLYMKMSLLLVVAPTGTLLRQWYRLKYPFFLSFTMTDLFIFLHLQVFVSFLQIFRNSCYHVCSLFIHYKSLLNCFKTSLLFMTSNTLTAVQ